MNKVFKVIWNTATQSYSVVSELSRAKGKPTKSSVLSKAIALALSVVGVTSAYAAEIPDTYFHVNTGAADQPAGNATTNEGSIDSKAGATGDRSIAVGMNARAEGISSISIGRDASNSQASANAIAIGRNAKNTGDASRSVTIGENALSEGSNTSVTIGYGAKTTMNSLPDPKKTSLRVGGWAVAIGRNATANYDSIAIGAGAEAATDPNGANRYGTLGWSTAVGRGAKATAHASTAYGANTVASKEAAVAVGVGAKATALRATALGVNSVASGQSSLADGYGAQATGDFTVAVGNNARAENSLSVAIGSNSQASGLNSMAAGVGANATGDYSVATGSYSRATGESSIANGRSAQAFGNDSIAIGRNAVTGSRQHSDAAAAIYSQTYTEAYQQYLADNGVDETTATDTQRSIASVVASSRALAERNKYLLANAGEIGTSSIAIGNNSSVQGDYSSATGHGTIITGDASQATGNNNIVGETSSNVGIFGNNNQMGVTVRYDERGNIITYPEFAEDEDGNPIWNEDLQDFETIPPYRNIVDVSGSRVVGNNNAITTKNTFVLGNGINTADDGMTPLGDTVENSVYLGNDSTAAAGTAVGTKNTVKDGTAGSTTTAGDKGKVSSATVNGVTYGGFAGSTANGVVTVGSAGEERRIQNVAAGEISSTSTDAINGSQLYMVAKEVGKSKEVVKSTDNTVKVTTTQDANGSNIFDLSVNIKGDGDTIINTTEGNLTVNTTDLKDDNNDGKVDSPTQPTALVNAQNITNAINNSGFNVAENDIKTGELVNPGDTVNFVNGNVTTAVVNVINGVNTIKYDVNVDNETIRIVDGKLTVNKNVTGPTSSSGLTFTGNNEALNRHKLNTVVKVVGEGVDKAASDNFKSATGNINVKANGADTLEIQLAKMIDLTEDGSVTTGDTTVNNDGLTIKNGPSVTKAGVNAGGKKVTNVADGEISRTSKDAVNGGQLYNAIQNTGWDLTVDGNVAENTGSTRVANNGKATIKGGNNIVVSRKGSEVTVATSMKPTFDTVTANEVKVGDVTINNNGINAGNKQITNVADGKADSDAVNMRQLNQVKNDVANINNRIGDVDKDLRAGIAGALAAGNLYHVTQPGKSMISAGAGTYRGQGAVALGYSRLSDNGKVGVKFSVNSNSRGHAGAAASVGYQW